MGEAMAQLRIEDPVKWRRSDVLITTKIFFGGDGRNENGRWVCALSRRWDSLRSG